MIRLYGRGWCCGILEWRSYRILPAVVLQRSISGQHLAGDFWSVKFSLLRCRLWHASSAELLAGFRRYAIGTLHVLASPFKVFVGQ